MLKFIQYYVFLSNLVEFRPIPCQIRPNCPPDKPHIRLPSKASQMQKGGITEPFIHLLDDKQYDNEKYDAFIVQPTEQRARLVP